MPFGVAGRLAGMSKTCAESGCGQSAWTLMTFMSSGPLIWSKAAYSAGQLTGQAPYVCRRWRWHSQTACRWPSAGYQGHRGRIWTCLRDQPVAAGEERTLLERKLIAADGERRFAPGFELHGPALSVLRRKPAEEGLVGSAAGRVDGIGEALLGSAAEVTWPVHGPMAGDGRDQCAEDDEASEHGEVREQ